MELSLRILALALDSNTDMGVRCQCLLFLHKFHAELLERKSFFGFTPKYCDLLSNQAEFVTLLYSATFMTQQEQLQVGTVITTNLELVLSSKRQIQRCIVVLLGDTSTNQLRWSELLSDETIETTYVTLKNKWRINPDKNNSIWILNELLLRAECITGLLKAINEATSTIGYLPVIFRQIDLLAIDALLEHFFLDVNEQDNQIVKRTNSSPRSLHSEMGYYHEVAQQQHSARERSRFISLRHTGQLDTVQLSHMLQYLNDHLIIELNGIFDQAKLLNCQLWLPNAHLKEPKTEESNKSTSSTIIMRQDSVSGFDNAGSGAEPLLKPHLNRNNAFFKARDDSALKRQLKESSDTSLFQSIG